MTQAQRSGLAPAEDHSAGRLAPPYGKMRSETLGIVFGALGVMKTPWVRLFSSVVSFVKTGDRLEAVEATWLGSWLSERGMGGADPSEVYTVQIPIDWAAAEFFDGHPQSVQRAIDGLVENGVLSVVRKGTRGHATLYCVMPPPSHPANGDVRVTALWKTRIPSHSRLDTLTFRAKYPHIETLRPAATLLQP